MAKLKYSCQITERRNLGKTEFIQAIEIEVAYDDQEDSATVESVNLFQNGKLVAEISTLLYKTVGDPLSAIVENVNWREIYRESKHQKLQEA